jgi:hypothetical protein
MADWRPESDVVTRRLRREIAVFGKGDILRVEDVKFSFIVTLQYGNQILVCARECVLLERVRQTLMVNGEECGEITEPPERIQEGGRQRFRDWTHFYNAHDGEHRWILGEPRTRIRR